MTQGLIAAVLASVLGAACSERIDRNLAPEDLWLPADEEPTAPDLSGLIRVRVGSMNLHGGQEATPDMLAAFFSTLGLDVLALQEAPLEYSTAIAAMTELRFVEAVDGRAILSKTPLENAAHVELHNGRAFTHATSTIAGALFSLYSVHIGWNVEGDLQARELIDEHLALDAIPHLIVAGDFNDEHYSSQNNILEEQLADVWTALGYYPGQRISWPSTAFDGSEGSQLIDLIFFRRNYPAIAVFGDVVNLSPVLSDHKPVWVELAYPPADAPALGDDPYRPFRDVWRDFPPPGDRPPNLLVNSGAENGTEGWSISGDAVSTEQRQAIEPKSGRAFFSGYESGGADDHFRSAGSQTIDLSAHAEEIDRGGADLLASAEMATAFNTVSDGAVISNFVRPYDEGEIIVELFDAEQQLLARVTSGRRDTLAWHPYAARFAVAPGARSGRYTFLSHRKPTSGESNDAVFDDLYLAYSTRGEPSSLVGGNLLRDGGAEEGALGAWAGARWRAMESGVQLGLMLFPPQSFSGAYAFFLGGELGLDGGDGASIAQTVTCPKGQEVAVRFGGRVRSYQATASVKISLEILDGDGSLWGTLALDPVSAAEWTHVAGRARVPAGASAVRFVLEGSAVPEGDALFADELYVVPETVEKQSR